ncbi:hypothetical protein AAC691_20835 [Nguyenibacter vanlangensis]|uniref:Poly(3-hydroxyalkanoate) polymerase subunit PhaE n=1 Tax=Nguyenibacter vanlangensis TaxID=1216886 RepID=A0ABZ3D4J6_9PROT
MTGNPPDPAALMRDWMAIWQSEGAALRMDREWAETMQRVARFWTEHAAPAPTPAPASTSAGAEKEAAGDAAAGEGARDRDAGSWTGGWPPFPAFASGADAAPWAAPAGAAPAGGGELGAIRAQLDRIERRLDQLDARLAGRADGGDAPRPKRGRRAGGTGGGTGRGD